MDLFRVDPDHPFEGPHQGLPVATAGVPAEEAEAALLLVHGRGASAESMLLFADELEGDGLHYRALQARGHTWYPYSFLAPREQNQPGLSSGLQAIHDQLQELERAGLPADRVILLGFSQGACLATEFAARHPRRFGGVAGLSGGLIGAELQSERYHGSLEGTPVFLGCSDRDPHIPQERVDATAGILEALEGDVTCKIYPGMGHTVNTDEIGHLQAMIDRLRGA